MHPAPYCLQVGAVFVLRGHGLKMDLIWFWYLFVFVTEERQQRSGCSDSCSEGDEMDRIRSEEADDWLWGPLRRRSSGCCVTWWPSAAVWSSGLLPAGPLWLPWICSTCKYRSNFRSQTHKHQTAVCHYEVHTVCNVYSCEEDHYTAVRTEVRFLKPLQPYHLHQCSLSTFIDSF